MRHILRSLFILPVALLLAAPTASAQVKIAPGAYDMIPDANYSAGFDVTGIVIEFSDSTMTALQNGMVLVKSTLKFEGDHVTLTDIEGQVACGGPARFKVTISEAGVKLTPVEDPCPERGAVLGQVTLKRRG